MAWTLPDTAAAGDAGHVTDHNLILTALSSLDVAWTTFVPALTASSVNPSLGTGSAYASGYYGRLGRTVICRFAFRFGTGSSAGTGTYRISLPVTAATSGEAIARRSGTLFLYDASTGNSWSGGIAETADAGTTMDKLYVSAGGALQQLAATVPWTWALDDQLSGFFFFEAAS